ncbi:hypothetical protein HID58_010738 [Brassica napus]|uniref:Uncharacterized protein n=1 Tax=Brassica napus TaxID=3708 RepID=A0ABQ8DYV4_BRANA|nr:hypothetical protein HID58_010738 [Brassica napus]
MLNELCWTNLWAQSEFWCFFGFGYFRDVGTEEEALLKNVERMESDIVAGCFCNAAQVIGMKCLVTAVEVREAAMHLGRTEKILEIVDRRCMPALSHHEVAKIDEWTEVEDVSPPLPEADKDGGVIVTESSTHCRGSF